MSVLRRDVNAVGTLPNGKEVYRTQLEMSRVGLRSSLAV